MQNLFFNKQARPFGSMWNWRKKTENQTTEVMAQQKCSKHSHISKETDQGSRFQTSSLGVA